MKILFFIDGLIAGGKERRLIELLKGFRGKSDIEFKLVLMNKDVHYQEVFDLGIKIHFLQRKVKKDISVFFKFYKICKRFKPDIVHCWDGMTAIYSIPACKLLGVKLINGMVTDAPINLTPFKKYWFRIKLAFHFSNIIVGNSQAGLMAYHARKKKSVCIYNGFNFERINNLESVEKTRQQLKIDTGYIIGMVASFSAFKDYKTYFKAAQIILEKRDDITFLAIGSNTDSDDTREMIGDKYNNHFRLLGKRSDVESLVMMMDICVLSTFSEGISNSILEYMALEKPVIASAGGGTNEIIEDQKTGFLVTPGDPEMLAEKIQLLLKDPALRYKLGQAGKENIKSTFSIEKMITKYLVLYKTVCKQNGSSEIQGD